VIELPDLNILNTTKLKKEGVVSRFDWTKRGIIEGTNELVISSYKGINFGSYDESHNFTENKDEMYFNSCTVTSFYEYDLDKFVCAICNDSNENYVQLIDRGTKDITVKVHHPASIQSVL